LPDLPVGLGGPVVFGNEVGTLDNRIVVAIDHRIDGELLAINSATFSGSMPSVRLNGPPADLDVLAFGGAVLAFTVTRADWTGQGSLLVYLPTLSIDTGFVLRAEMRLDASLEPIAVDVGVPEEEGEAEDGGVEPPLPPTSEGLIHVLVREAR
jgi:hypothetical protein